MLPPQFVANVVQVMISIGTRCPFRTDCIEKVGR
jgi:hypothetical protein